MKSSISLAFAVALAPVWSAQAEPVPNAKAAELSLHRIERLVILKKIDAAFETAVQSLRLERLDHQTPDQAAFQSTVTLVPAADGTRMSVTIPMDETGKALSFATVAGGAPAGAPAWPVVDAVTLAENCFHYIEDGYQAKPELVPFNDGVTSLDLVAGTDSTGAQAAVATLRAS
ncbi:MAG TPA: hypothetical protein VL588_13260, partial [Bdellovibrionota bacterium]|nr:hypothetical protein [Bdellovibrionota bacterium]